MTDAPDSFVLVRIDGEDAGRFADLHQAQLLAARDVWLDTLNQLEFIAQASSEVLERWLKHHSPEQSPTAQ